MGLNQIINGHLKELLNQESELSEERLKICRECKLYKVDKVLGPICDKNIYWSPITDAIASEPTDGYVNGCGCRLKAKTRIIEARCPLKKW